MCPAIFRDVNLLIEHSLKEHRAEAPVEEVKIEEVKKEEIKKPENTKCPECFKRFSVLELPSHMQTDHFIF